MALKRLSDCEPGELVYTYTILFSNGLDIHGNVIETAWELSEHSPLLIVSTENKNTKILVVSEIGCLELHHSILIADRPYCDWDW